MNKDKSRREFIKAVIAGTCGGVIHKLTSPANSFMAFADPIGGNDNVLVVLNLAGGVSMNIAPIYLSHYRDRNPNISYGPENSIVLTNEQGLHPSLTNLTQVWQEGDLAVLNLIGAGPGQSRSHEVASDQWWTQNRNPAVASGWGSRLTSLLQQNYGGVSFSGVSAFTRGGKNPVKLLNTPLSLAERDIFNNTNDGLQLRLARTNMVASSGSPTTEAMEHTLNSMIKFQENIELLRPIGNASLPNTFPNTTLGRRFADMARLIRAGQSIGLKLGYISHGGYDTHENEAPALVNRLNEVNSALGAFIQCMKLSNLWNKVVIVTMSEFSRTMQNGSSGTDHGLAGVQLVMGGAVRGGILTPPPTALEIGNFEFVRASHGTFSQVYAEIVEKHLGLDASKVFNGDIPRTPYFSVVK